jgi:hypothetical protein
MSAWMFFDGDTNNAFASFDSHTEAERAFRQFKIDVPDHGGFVVVAYDSEGKRG